MNLLTHLKELRKESWQEVIKEDSEYITVIPIKVIDRIIAQLEAAERLAKEAREALKDADTGLYAATKSMEEALANYEQSKQVWRQKKSTNSFM